MKPNRLREAMRERTALMGALVTIPGWLPPQVLAQAGYGMLMFDWQHEPFTEASMAESLASGAAAGCVCLVRTAANRPDQIGFVLDQGAHGVVVPLVNSPADAQAAVAACRYAPHGKRSVGGNRNHLLHGREYFGTADDDVVCALQIEHIDAVAAIDEILAVPGVDAVVPGPVDLTRSLGRGASYAALREPPPETVEGLRRVREACRRAGILYIPPCESKADAEMAARDGNRIVLSGSDIALLTRAARDQVKTMKPLLETVTDVH